MVIFHSFLYVYQRVSLFTASLPSRREPSPSPVASWWVSAPVVLADVASMGGTQEFDWMKNLFLVVKHGWYICPRCSMYGIFTYIWAILGVNVGKYHIHGASGCWIMLTCCYILWPTDRDAHSTFHWGRKESRDNIEKNWQRQERNTGSPKIKEDDSHPLKKIIQFHTTLDISIYQDLCKTIGDDLKQNCCGTFPHVPVPLFGILHTP